MSRRLKFKVGDKVRVKTKRFGIHQYDNRGEVYRVDAGTGTYDLPVRVRFSENRFNCYAHHDLELLYQTKFEKSVREYINKELGL